MKPCIIAHRGAKTEAPENTRRAFDKALSYSADGIEFDVRMTKDSKAVVYHDRTLFKINRSRKRISDHTYKELRTYDWGGWYSPEYADEPLLTLADTLKLYALRAYLMIEIKSDRTDSISGRNFKLTDIVLKEIENHVSSEYLENIFILSFDHEVLKSAFRKKPYLKYVLNLSDKDEEPFGPGSVMRQHRSETDFLNALCINRKYLSEKLSEFAHDSGKRIMTYSCNNSVQVKKALAMKADVLMTDNPGWLTDYLQVVHE